jgi:tetratricopeptide (TPR) repeat protein
MASETSADPLQSALANYVAQRQAAETLEQDRAAWQRAADAGEELLSLLGAMGASGEPVDELKAHIASTYNALGTALDATDKVQALAAFERAIALQPDFAMWHRNRAGILIELGRLDQAEAAIAQARALEPEAPRLAELDAELAIARGTSSSQEE